MSNKETIDWTKWGAADHIVKAQKLCAKAEYQNTSDSASYYLKTAHVHSMLALAARVDRLTEVLLHRLPAVPHE